MYIDNVELSNTFINSTLYNSCKYQEIHWLSFNMQFVNIYVRADSSTYNKCMIETDNI